MIEKFLIKCSGAVEYVLAESPIDKNKHVGIGATIFLTAVLASISGGYAIYFTFENFLVSFIFGIVWGLTIFNIDRYIIISIKKTGNKFKEFLTALPRILIAFLLAISISKPLEIRLFEGSINQNMSETEVAYNNKSRADFNNQINSLNQQKTALNNELDKKGNLVYSGDPILADIQQRKSDVDISKEKASKLISYNNEVVKRNTFYEEQINKNTGAVNKISRYNSIAQSALVEIGKQKNIFNQMNSLSTSLSDSILKRKSVLVEKVNLAEKQTQKQLIEIQSQIDELNSHRGEIFSKIQVYAANDKDLLSRLRALSKLKKDDETVYWVSLLITILFLLIETAPIIVKLIGSQGVYDVLLHRKENEIIIDQKILLNEYLVKEEEYQKEKNLLRKMREKNRIKIEELKLRTELNANDSIFKDISKKQVHLSKKKIAKWYSEEVSSDLKLKKDVHWKKNRKKGNRFQKE